MDFKVRKISQKPKTSWWKSVIKKLPTIKKKTVLIAGSVLVIGALAYGFFVPHGGAGNRPIFNLSPLKADQYGHTNILVLGVAGFAKEGGHLSDSIMLVSVNQKEKGISMVSLPRDLFVSSRVGDRKINEVYASAQYKYGESTGLEVAKDAVAKFTGVDVHYAAVVDFNLFSDAIDVLGGIEIFVPKAINDPFYPADNYEYQTFVVRNGLQTMDGETALKYARSRKTSSDYDRAQRQQNLGLAIKTKIEKQGLLTNPLKLKELYGLFKKRVNTDMSLTELGFLAKHVSGVEYKNVINSVLNDDPNQKGGILYTPAKEFYGGQFVLLPDDKAEAKAFFQLTIKDKSILTENAQISILNGSKQTGKARTLSKKLRRLGFHVIETGNYETDKALLEHRIKDISQVKSDTKLFLQEYLNISREEPVAPLSPGNENEVIDIEIVLGTDKI